MFTAALRVALSLYTVFIIAVNVALGKPEMCCVSRGGLGLGKGRGQGGRMFQRL